MGIDYQSLLKEALELEAQTFALLERVREDVLSGDGEKPSLTDEENGDML